MKILIAAMSLLLPIATAGAQQTPDPRIAAQEVVRAEIVRWHFPLSEGEKRYPDILGTNTVGPVGDLCVSDYTIRYAAFRDGDTNHAAVVRDVPMKWRNAARLARRDGNFVILTWRMRSLGKMSTGSNDRTFDWRLDMENPVRAKAFVDAANILINACMGQPLIAD